MRFFTSDHHFGHKNVIKYCNRPFQSSEEMDEALVEKWNQTVGKDDEVWYLGDFSLSKQAVREIVPKLNGKKILVAGNHDWCHPVQTKGKEPKVQRMGRLYLDAGFSEILLTSTMEIAGWQAFLSHMPPMFPDQGDLRYPEHRPDRGRAPWFIHGHVHCSWKVRENCINVGVDVWDFAPVPEIRLQEIILYEY